MGRRQKKSASRGEESHSRVVDGVQQGRLDARLWIDLEHPYALADIAQAVTDTRSRRVVKALIRVQGKSK